MEEPRVDLYKADVATLVKHAGAVSVWWERWDKGDGLTGEDLQVWFNRQREATPDSMYYKGASGNQIMYVRDEISRILFAGADDAEIECKVQVVSEHRSKSVALPVYRLERKDLGIRIYLRDNFYNWKLSVDSARPVNCDFTGLFETSHTGEKDYSGDKLASCYFEGFPHHVVFGHYGASDGRRWSAELYGREQLWATIFLMMRSFGQIDRVESSGRVQHRRELDADTARSLLRERHPEVKIPPYRLR